MRKFIFLAWFFMAMLLVSGCEVSRPSDEAAPSVKQSASPTTLNIQEEAILKIQPEISVVKADDTLTLEILVENVSDLMGADVALQFDPAVLQAQDAVSNEDGVQIQPGPFLSPDFQVINTVDNQAGAAQYTLVQLAPSKPAGGSGVLATITFKAIAAGVSQLTFTKTDLASAEAQRIMVTPIPGQVTVEP